MSRLADSGELVDLAAIADDVVGRNLTGLRQRLESTDVIDASVINTLVSAGLWSVGVPETIGGQGGDLRAAAVVAYRLAREAPAVAVSLIHAHSSIAALMALDELDAAARCTAGEPMVVSFARWPDSMRVDLSRVDLGLAPSLVVVATSDATALAHAPASALDHRSAHIRTGLGGLGTASASVAGLSKRAHPAAVDVTRWWTLGLAAAAIGAASGAVDRAEAYVRERVQFGGPLINQAAVRVATQKLRADVAVAEASLAQRLSSPPEARGDEVAARAIMRTCVRSALGAVQLHGGYGYLREFPVEGLTRDLISLRAAATLTDR